MAFWCKLLVMHEDKTKKIHGKIYAGVISRGLRGWSPLAKFLVHYGRLSLTNFCTNPVFQSVPTLIQMCIVLLCSISSLLHGHYDLSRSQLQCITLRLNHYVSRFRHADVAANGPHPLHENALRAPF